LTLRGRCELRKRVDTITIPSADANMDVVERLSDSIHIGYASPMSFLGFVPHFINAETGTVGEPQPLTVVAETTVRVLVLDADVFISCLKETPAIFKVLSDLAKRQKKWLDYYLPRKLLCNEEDQVEPFPNSSMIELEGLLELALTKKPVLNKHKVLTEFKRLVCGEEETDLDPFSRINFSGLSMNKLLLKDIEADWGDDGDTAMLKPYPSISNRKFHGKALPWVAQSNGFQDPFQQ